jgi:hypothetical protein
VEVAAEDFDSVVGEQAGGGGAVAPGLTGGRADLAYSCYEGDAVGEVGVGWEDGWVWWEGLGCGGHGEFCVRLVFGVWYR